MTHSCVMILRSRRGDAIQRATLYTGPSLTTAERSYEMAKGRVMAEAKPCTLQRWELAQEGKLVREETFNVISHG